MKDKEYIVYDGEAFTFEWYYDQKGKSQPYDFLESLTFQEQAHLPHKKERAVNHMKGFMARTVKREYYDE